jgi:hypothetical protein
VRDCPAPPLSRKCEGGGAFPLLRRPQRHSFPNPGEPAAASWLPGRRQQAAPAASRPCGCCAAYARAAAAAPGPAAPAPRLLSVLCVRGLMRRRPAGSNAPSLDSLSELFLSCQQTAAGIRNVIGCKHVTHTNELRESDSRSSCLPRPMQPRMPKCMPERNKTGWLAAAGWRLAACKSD